MDINKALYEGQEVIRNYTAKDFLYPCEAVILEKVKSRFSGKKILDLGVGGGRTVPFLRKISEDYTGGDYSHGMVESCKRRFPEVRIIQCDARSMPMFQFAEFDLVFFSYNGIDCVGHDDRLKIMKEINRVLKPGGGFIFSTHNRGSSVLKPYRLANLEFSLKPRGMARNLLTYVSGIKNYLMNRHLEKSKAEYSLLVDSANNYTAVTYYITPANQIAQLEKFDFRVQDMLDKQGNTVDPFSNSRSPWVYYVTVKE